MNDYSMTAAVVSVTGPDGNELRVSREQYEADPARWGALWSEPSSPVIASSGKAAKDSKGKPKKAAADPDKVLSVIDEDGRYFVADGDGVKVEDDEHYAADGYSSDVEAWAAISAARA